MSDSNPFQPFDTDACPTSPPRDLGHSGAEWDISQSDELTELQLRAIELTLQGHNDVQIAQRLSIDRKTLWRWKTLDDDYRRVLANARAQVYGAATDRYQVLLGRATAILAKSLDDPADEHCFRVALAVLNMAGAFKPLHPKYFLPNPRAVLSEPRWDPPNLPPKVG